MSSFIFDDNDANNLMGRNLMQRTYGRRWRINSSLVFDSSSSSEDSSVDSAIDVTLAFTVPELIESEECLEYLGFTDARAADIWADWLVVKSLEENSNTLRHSFLDYALSAIPGLKVGDHQASWHAEMLSWGIRSELREAIMDAAYTNIRLTEIAQHWVKDTMEIRYLTLERLQKESRIRGQATPRGNSTTPNITSLHARKSNVPGHISLYKAISQERVRIENDKIQMDSLLTASPSDFRGAAGTLLSFTSSFDVAENYRGYIKRRHNAAKPVMIQLKVPNSLIEGLPPVILPFGDLWKEVVYTSRRGNLLQGDLKKIHRKSLIIGPIFSSHNRAISSFDDFHQITISNVLFVKGTEGTQYVFQGDDMLDRLEETTEAIVIL